MGSVGLIPSIPMLPITPIPGELRHPAEPGGYRLPRCPRQLLPAKRALDFTGRPLTVTPSFFIPCFPDHWPLSFVPLR